MGTVIVVHGEESGDELIQSLRALGTQVRFARNTDQVLALLEVSPAEAVLIELGDDETLLPELTAAMPEPVHLITIGDPRTVNRSAEGPPPHCVVLSQPDEGSLRGILTRGKAVSLASLVDELLGFSAFGPDLPTTLHELASRLARAFDANDCIVVLPEEGTSYAARDIDEAVISELATLCDTVCQFSTTVIAPPRPGRPYRAFLGLALAHDNAPPAALLLLCRESPVPFTRDAVALLRAVATRLSADLSWRLVHERLLADRDKLRDLSRIDPVLGVANRTALEEELSRRVAASLRRGEPFSVAVIDVDGLRLINERSGYPAGDAVLAHVAQVARLKTRAQDIVARYAGDAIAVVLPGANAAEATDMITTILSEIDAEPPEHENAPINLTVSAGIAELRYDDDTGEAALGRAMAARDRARLHGEVIALADGTNVDAPAQVDFAIGTTLGGVYQIRHEISRGAFGVVYRAEDLALGRQVALKLLRPDLARDTAFVERFRSEAATLARIRNPNLVQVYAFGVDGQNVFFAMELVEGQGLDERIHSAQKRRRHLPIPEVISLIEQVGDALEAVHRAGMLHRDVKPENVLIDRIHRRCVLVDVGIAVRRGEKNAAGTPGYTAPEVFGEGLETPATDVYGLAAVAYVLLTLQSPFGDAGPVEILSLQATERPRPLTKIRRDLPQAVDAVLLPALDPDPAKRPQSARELAKALAEALAPSPAAQQPEGARIKPRQTVDPEFRRPHIAPQPSLPSLRPASSHSGPSTRGVLFRSAYEVLGARRGSAWLGAITKQLPELALALAPQSSPLAWHPTTSFISVLHSLGADEAERCAVALQLGRVAIDSSFRQFYGADPSAVSPQQVLRAVDLYWSCYHSWGQAAVTARELDAEVTVKDGIANRILCASTSGLLTGVIARAGAQSISVEHPTCVADGANKCTFHVSWRLPAS